jgi:hypothetical protein
MIMISASHSGTQVFISLKKMTANCGTHKTAGGHSPANASAGTKAEGSIEAGNTTDQAASKRCTDLASLDIGHTARNAINLLHI